MSRCTLGTVCVKYCGTQTRLETKYLEPPGEMGSLQLSERFSYPVTSISQLLPCRMGVELPIVGLKVELRTFKVLELSPFPGEGEATR